MKNSLAFRLLDKNYDKEHSGIKAVNIHDEKGMVLVLNEKDKTVPLKVGKFLSKLYEVKGPDVEEFLEEYVSYQPKKYEGNPNIEIVEGEDLIKWYHQNNYGSIDGYKVSSCSSYSNKPEAFYRILADNPKQVKLLVYFKNYDGKKKLVGRCLLWYLDNGKVFMDRIYTTTSNIRNEIRIHCVENGFYVRSHDSSTVFYNDDYGNYTIKNDFSIITKTGTIENENLTVTLENVPKHLAASPYLDSITYLNIETGVMTKYGPKDKTNVVRLQVYGGNGRYFLEKEAREYELKKLTTKFYSKLDNHNAFVFEGLTVIVDDKRYVVKSYTDTHLICEGDEKIELKDANLHY